MPKSNEQTKNQGTKQWDKSIIYIFTMSSHWTDAVIDVVCFNGCWLHLNSDRKSHIYCKKYYVWISHEYIVTQIVLSYTILTSHSWCFSKNLIVAFVAKLLFMLSSSLASNCIKREALSRTEKISLSSDELYKPFCVPFSFEIPFILQHFNEEWLL